MRQSTTILGYPAEDSPVQRLGDGIEGAWRWWENDVAFHHTVNAAARLVVAILLVWAITWAVRLEIDRARRRRGLKRRITEAGKRRLAAEQSPPPPPPVDGAREEPGA